MKKALLVLLLFLTACTSNEISSDIPDNVLIAPQPIAPDSGHEFVDSDLTLSWEWPQLEQGQLFVLHLWYGEEAPQEVWTSENQINTQNLIDSYSHAVGDYYWQVAIVNTNADGGFQSMGSEWSDIQVLHRVRRLSFEPLAQEQQSDTTQLIMQQGFDTNFERINFLRDWVYHNTDIGAELLIYEPDYQDASQMMFEHSQGISDAPQMYCNGMSTVMLTTLYELGIESRLIFLYSEVSGWIAQHTFLEIFNPDTQLWEIHDPTNNLYYINNETGQRIDTQNMIFGNIETIAACTTDGDCSLDYFENGVKQFVGAFRYGFSNEIWVNPDHMDISRRVTAFDNANFPEFMAKIIDVPTQDLIFRFDNWNSPELESE